MTFVIRRLPFSLTQGMDCAMVMMGEKEARALRAGMLASTPTSGFKASTAWHK